MATRHITFEVDAEVMAARIKATEAGAHNVTQSLVAAFLGNEKKEAHLLSLYGIRVVPEPKS